MASSSCDSEEEICWWKTKNLIKERLIDGSLIHTLKRARKLQKETKRINISLRNYVTRKLRKRRESLNSSKKHKNTSTRDTCIVTESESSGVDDVFMINSKPLTSVESHSNSSATSKHSSSKANVKSKTKVSKDVQAYSKETEKIMKQNLPPKATNENRNSNRSTDTNKILRSMRKGSQVSSLISANQGNTTLSPELYNHLSDKPSFTAPINKHNGVLLNGESIKNNLTYSELHNHLSDKPSFTAPINKLNGVLLNGESIKNNLTYSEEEINHTVNSIKLNISSEEITDPVRRLPKGPATIKKNLFNTVKDIESDVHESQEIRSCDSESSVNENKNESNSTSKLYEYSSVSHDDDTGLSRNDTVSSDAIESWPTDMSCNFTDDSRTGSIVINELTKHDDMSVEKEKTISTMNMGKTEECTKNDSVVSVHPAVDNFTLDNNNDIKIKEIDINKSNDSEDIAKVIKRPPDNDSIKCGNFHENTSIKEDSDLLLKHSNINTSDKNNLPEKLNSNMKFQEKNAESSKTDWSNIIQNSVQVSKNIEQNSLEEIKSPTHSLSWSKCDSISGDDSIRTRYVPKVKSNKMLNTRYKIVKLHEEGKDVSSVRPIMTSSPNAKSLHHQENTVNKISKGTNNKFEKPKSTMITQDNPNVSEGFDKSDLEERNNSHTAININHPKKLYDSYQENSGCSNDEEHLPMQRRTLNFNTSSESHDSSLKGKEHFTYPKTPNSKKIVRKKGSHVEHEEGRTNQRNSSNLGDVNEILNTEVTSDQEINDDLNLSPTHLSNSNRILSTSATEIQSLRCVMQTLNTRKERYNVDVLKEYEDQYLKKRVEQVPSESINTVHNRRPVKIQDLVAQSNFTEESSVASLTMNDISDDDEIFIFEIPKTVDVHNFRDKKFIFQGNNEIIIGGKKFEVYERENRSMSIVLNKGDLKRSYGAVNLKAVRSVYIRPKILNNEIDVHRVDKGEEAPKSSTVPFPKNLRSRHPLLGRNVVANKVSVSEENEDMDATSKKILKWLESQDQYNDDDPVTNGQHIGEQVKSRKQIVGQEDEDVAMRVKESDDVLESPRKKRRLKSTTDKHRFKYSEMQYNNMEDGEVKQESSIKSSPRKKRNIVLSDTFDETVTTNDDMLSMDIKSKKKMLKKKKREIVDKPKFKLDDESGSITLKCKSSMNCSDLDSDIRKKKFKTSLDFSKDKIRDKNKFVKSATKMKLDNELEIREKESQVVDTEVMKDEVNNRLGLETSEESKMKIRKHKKRKEKSIKDFDDSTETQKYISLPERINEDILSSTWRARKEQQKRSRSSPKEKPSSLKKIKRKIQLDRTLSRMSGVKKLNATIEGSQEEDQSCCSRSSKNKQKKHVCLKDVLQCSYPPKIIPILSPKKRCHSFSKFESDFESKSYICKRKESKKNLCDVDDSGKEDKLVNL